MKDRVVCALKGLACAGVVTGLVVGILVGAAGAAAAKELSDRSVRVLMNYAWVLLPTKFTSATGKVIEVDKKKHKKDVMIPLDVARHIIKVARLTAHAQICKLDEYQAINYRTMMAREVQKKKWTDQQLLYISNLHLFTVMWLTGNVKVVEENGKKEVVLNKAVTGKEQTCTDAQRNKVKQQIEAYIESGRKKGKSKS